jgi:hypothetical protein
MTGGPDTDATHGAANIAWSDCISSVDLGANANTPSSQALFLGQVRCEKLGKGGSRRHKWQASLHEVRQLSTLPRNEVRIDPDFSRWRSRTDEVLDTPYIREGHGVAGDVARRKTRRRGRERHIRSRGKR